MKRTLGIVGRLIMISRPLVWLPAICLYAFGVQMSGASFYSPYVWIGLIFFGFPAGIIAYGLNDIADRTSDALNYRKGHVYGAVVRDEEVKAIMSAALCCAALFIGLFTATERYGTALALAAICALSVAYSLPPLRLKGKPGLDAISNGVIIALIFLAGYSVSTLGLPHQVPAPLILGILLCAGSAMHIFTAVLDYDVDKIAGDRTLAVAVGRRSALTIVAGLIAMCFWLVYDSSKFAAGYFAVDFITLVVLCVHPSPRWLHRSLGILVGALIISGAVVLFN